MDMLDFDSAQSRLAQAGKLPQDTETCPLREARGRVLAETILAAHDLPPADNSAMDGYAIHGADYRPGAAFPVQQRCFAGQAPEPLRRGNTIRLFTGSLMPAGADTVVMQEDCTETDNILTLNQAPVHGAHVRKQGEDVRKGQRLLPAGTLLDSAEIALLASQGCESASVYPRLKVGILTTGDELIEPGQPLRPAQIYNSNGATLAALAEKLGARVVHVLHAADTHASLRDAFTRLVGDCDLVLSVGGVSVGEKDLVKAAIEQMGGTVDLWRVRMKPGKPVALAQAHARPIICLPGNPVSAYVVFTLLVTPLIRAMQGRSQLFPPIGYGRLNSPTTFNETREEFLRVQAGCLPDGSISLTPYAQQGSGIISSLPWASGVARIAANTLVGQGDIVPYYSFAHWQS